MTATDTRWLHGIEHVTKDWSGGCMTGFILWIGERWREWKLAQSPERQAAAKRDGDWLLHTEDHASFDAMLAGREKIKLDATKKYPTMKTRRDCEFRQRRRHRPADDGIAVHPARRSFNRRGLGGDADEIAADGLGATRQRPQAAETERHRHRHHAR